MNKPKHDATPIKKLTLEDLENVVGGGGASTNGIKIEVESVPSAHVIANSKASGEG